MLRIWFKYLTARLLLVSVALVVSSLGANLMALALFLVIRPFSRSLYRRLVSQYVACMWIDALSLLLPGTQIHITGDSGASLFPPSFPPSVCLGLRAISPSRFHGAQGGGTVEGLLLMRRWKAFHYSDGGRLVINGSMLTWGTCLPLHAPTKTSPSLSPSLPPFLPSSLRPPQTCPTGSPRASWWRTTSTKATGGSC
ncbi:hypothetical protein Naga_100695g3 [Nannochloropsis gaditana]|uniref:Uncharacterized protein n=1 Tax=Nannochloropsis gaditana TaxID=72520 RepID=W7U018_9STRA|nr:hypothetical protein Naga_100695g3 [Nannochloropsis gaditana]